jgi:ribulose-5-phosphate 4-epimerase/fuculose-1-phosphate aldolase
VLVVGKDVAWAVLAAVTLERAVRLQTIAASLGPVAQIPRQTAERMLPEKYNDTLVDEYWAAWIRRLRRSGLGLAE